jgi:hypothetical protein
MNWKGCERERLWSGWMYYPGICQKGLRKTIKILRQNSQSPSWDLNLGPPEYDKGVLTTRPLYSAYNLYSSPDLFFFVALQSLRDLGRLTYRRFLELFRHMVGLPGRVISPSQGLYLHRTTQHRKTRTNIHALSGIRTHDPSNHPAKTHGSDRTATVTGTKYY